MSGRIEKEKHIAEVMIRLYCRKAEGNSELCGSCLELLEYVKVRLDKCPYGDGKKSCKDCPVHCYRKDMKERIKRVMRYSGPRMLLYAPLEVLRHWLKN